MTILSIKEANLPCGTHARLDTHADGTQSLMLVIAGSILYLDSDSTARLRRIFDEVTFERELEEIATEQGIPLIIR